MSDILYQQSTDSELNNPLLAGINRGEINDDLLLASGIKSSAERLELKIENINTDKDDLFLPQNDLGKLDFNKSEESLEKTPIDKEDPLTGKGNNVVEQVDPLTGDTSNLTGDTSNEIEIQTRAGKKRDKAGNSRGKAYNFGVLKDDKLQEFVGRSDRKDFYKFRVKEKTDVDIELRGLSGNADLYLLNKKGKVLKKSVKGGKKVENIEEPLEQGTYYVKVQSKGKANANYTLSLDGELPDMGGNSLNKAYDLGVLQDDQNIQEFVGRSDRKDFYEFNVNENTDLDIELRDLSGNANVYLLNNEGKVLDKSTKGGKKEEHIEWPLVPGDYYVKVQSKGKANANYNLSLDVTDSFVEHAEEGPIVIDLPELPVTMADELSQSFKDDGSIIDIMVVYTAEARQDEGGTNAIENLIESSVDKANEAFANSGVNPRLRLVHTAEVDYRETANSSQDLNRLQAPNDGYMDEVHTLRDEYGADIVSLFVSELDPNIGGIAYLTKNEPQYEKLAFNVVTTDSARQRQTFTHEVGHNLGLVHDRQNSTSGSPAFDYGYGYAVQNDFGTIMSYAFTYNADRIDYFSNPNITYQGKPTGTSTENAAKAINEIADTAANWRQSTDRTSSSSDSVTLTSPNGGETFEPGKNLNITWNDNIREQVKLELYQGNSKIRTITNQTASDGSYEWQIPSDLDNSSNYQIKIQSVQDSNVSDFSDNYFTVETNKYIEVISPNGGNVLEPGNSYNITWDDNISENVKLELYEGSSFNRTISSSTNSDGSYTWTVPQSIGSGSDYEVKITSVKNGSIFDYSNTNFSIEAADFINITSPNGGNTIQAGENYTITWDDNISENVDIYLYGDSYSLIASSTASDGSYTWNVPTNLSQNQDYWIYIQGAIDNNLYDFSDSTFSVSTANNSSDLYYFTYYYDGGDSYDGFFYDQSGNYSLYDFLNSDNGFYYVWDVYSDVGTKDDIGDVYVYSYNDYNYTGTNYEPYYWSYGLAAGESGLGSEFDYIPSFLSYDYFDPDDQADG